MRRANLGKARRAGKAQRASAPARAFTFALTLALGLGLGVSLAALAPAPADAAGDGLPPPRQDWSFAGPFGRFDQDSLQRGLQVYREVCSACHGIKRVAFRNVEALGYSPAQVKSLAAEYIVEDGPDDEGDFFERAALPSDRFPEPFANDNAARAANGGALPPDLSLITKARAGGADYIHALLTGYREADEAHPVPDGLYYNPYFAGEQIAMAPPLLADLVEYADGTPASVEQMSRDVTHFLVWAAEPELEARKATGLKTIIFLAAMALVLWAATRRVWARVDKP